MATKTATVETRDGVLTLVWRETPAENEPAITVVWAPSTARAREVTYNFNQPAGLFLALEIGSREAAALGGVR